MHDRGRLIVGLTGGIASGKSAVADAFAALGVALVDTDLLAREVVAPGQAALAAIVVQFGADIVDADGQLKRRELRSRVFADPEARARLEAITLPRIRALAAQRVADARGPYVVVVVPLLAEKGVYPFIDRVLVVDVAPEVQLARLTARDGIDLPLARAMLAAQASREQRLALAHDVIDNSGSLDMLKQSVAQLHERYVRLASTVVK